MGQAPETVAKDLFFAMTCISCLTCVIRSDFNFAFGLMGYYMVKTSNIKKIERTAYTVSTKLFVSLGHSTDLGGRPRISSYFSFDVAIYCVLTPLFSFLQLIMVTIALIIMDVLWCMTMRNVWASKPFKNSSSVGWFDYLRTLTLFTSWVNVAVKVIIVFWLGFITRQVQ